MWHKSKHAYGISKRHVDWMSATTRPLPYCAAPPLAHALAAVSLYMCTLSWKQTAQFARAYSLFALVEYALYQLMCTSLPNL